MGETCPEPAREDVTKARNQSCSDRPRLSLRWEVRGGCAASLGVAQSVPPCFRVVMATSSAVLTEAWRAGLRVPASICEGHPGESPGAQPPFGDPPVHVFWGILTAAMGVGPSAGRSGHPMPIATAMGSGSAQGPAWLNQSDPKDSG